VQFYLRVVGTDKRNNKDGRDKKKKANMSYMFFSTHQSTARRSQTLDFSRLDIDAFAWYKQLLRPSALESATAAGKVFSV
jgi:hypothetical protein